MNTFFLTGVTVYLNLSYWAGDGQLLEFVFYMASVHLVISPRSDESRYLAQSCHYPGLRRAGSRDRRYGMKRFWISTAILLLASVFASARDAQKAAEKKQSMFGRAISPPRRPSPEQTQRASRKHLARFHPL